MRNYKKLIAYGATFLLAYIIITILTETEILDGYYAGILIFVCINVILATSLNLISGITGQLCLGHAGFMAIGAYASAIISTKLEMNFFLAVLVGGIVAAAFSLLVGIPTLKLKGDYFAITTLAFGEIIRVLLLNFDYVGGARGFTGIPMKTTFTVAFIAMALTVIAVRNIAKSSQGRAMISIRENEIAAEAMGVNTTKYKIMAFVIAAFFAGVAGALYAHNTSYIAPSSFDFMKSVEIVTFVVFGGMGSLTGGIVATGVLTYLPEILRDFAEYRMIIYSLALIILMIFRPQGLLGTKEINLDMMRKLFKKKKTENSNVKEG